MHRHAAELAELAALDPSILSNLAITGPESVLPSSFAVTDGAVALVAAASAAVAAVADLRGEGKATPTIEVDTRHACAAFQSERHLTLERPVELWDPLAGHYEAADGHVQFHTNFAHHRAGLLGALGLREGASRSDVERVARLTGRFELETDVNAAGGIAAALRTSDEWTAHRHAIDTRDHRPLTLRSVSDTPPASLGRARRQRPLEGVRVLDMTRVIAGPVCARTLAAYGANVLRVGANTLPVIDSILADTTLGKRFCHLDLNVGAQRDTLLALIARADIVVTGFRPGSLDAMGLTREAMLNANPELVIAELSAFGTAGPWGSRRGFDSITQTATGIVDEETRAFQGRAPRPLPCQFLDHGSGYLLTLGVLAALLRRHHSGGGSLVEVSLLQTRNWLVSLGRRDDTEAPGIAHACLERYSTKRASPWGDIRHITHPGSIEGITSRWDAGPAMPGGDPPTWSGRDRT